MQGVRYVHRSHNSERPHLIEAFRLPDFAGMLTLIFVRYAGLLFQTQILPRKNQTKIRRKFVGFFRQNSRLPKITRQPSNPLAKNLG